MLITCLLVFNSYLHGSTSKRFTSENFLKQTQILISTSKEKACLGVDFRGRPSLI